MRSQEKLDLGGVFTALATPFDGEGALDEAALRRLVRRQCEAGVQGLVPCGTTGESPTLSEQEWERVVAAAVEECAGAIPVVAGTGTHDTRRTVARTRRAAELGADAALVVVPYYNKPNPVGLREHYLRVAGEGGLPVVVYNVPGRTGLNLRAEATLELAESPGIVAVKEASGRLDQVDEILRGRPEGFRVLSGDDALTLPLMALGAEGVISVVSNEDPWRLVALASAVEAGRLDEARGLHRELLPLMTANFVESNPVPVKAALHLQGLAGATVRAPLGPASEATVSLLREALSALGLLGEGR
jgi:4-hydroxy-tetrahydrodipicolinate synthase